jgi:zinc transporter ZupT
MQFDFALGVLVFVAVFLHKIPEGLTIATVMLVAEHQRRTALMASGAIGLATMLGVISVFLLSGIDGQVLGFAFSCAAGATIYVGASDLVPEINRSERKILPLLVFGGMLLFYLSRLVVARML